MTDPGPIWTLPPGTPTVTCRSCHGDGVQRGERTSFAPDGRETHEAYLRWCEACAGSGRQAAP